MDGIRLTLPDGRVIQENLGQGRDNREIIFDVYDRSGNIDQWRVFEPFSDQPVLTQGGANPNNIIDENADPNIVQTIGQIVGDRKKQWDAIGLTPEENQALTDYRQNSSFMTIGGGIGSDDPAPADVLKKRALVQSAQRKIKEADPSGALSNYAVAYSAPYTNNKSAFARAWGGGKGPLAQFALIVAGGAVASQWAAGNAAAQGSTAGATTGAGELGGSAVGSKGVLASNAAGGTANSYGGLLAQNATNQTALGLTAEGTGATGASMLASGSNGGIGALSGGSGTSALSQTGQSVAGQVAGNTVSNSLQGSGAGDSPGFWDQAGNWVSNQTKNWGIGDWANLGMGGLSLYEMFKQSEQSQGMIDAMTNQLGESNRLNQQIVDMANEDRARYGDIYAPVEEKLRDRVLNPQERSALSPTDPRVLAETNAVGNDVDSSFNALRGAQNRDMARYGIDHTSGKYSSLNRGMDIAQAAQKVAAVNRARRGAMDYYDNKDYSRDLDQYKKEADFLSLGRGVRTDALNALGGAANKSSSIASGYGNLAQGYAQDAAGWGQFAGGRLGALGKPEKPKDNYQIPSGYGG